MNIGDRIPGILQTVQDMLIRFEMRSGKRAEAILLGPIEYLSFTADVHEMSQYANEKRCVYPTKFMETPLMPKSCPGIDFAISPGDCARFAIGLPK